MPYLYERDDVRRLVVVTVTGPFQGADVFDLFARQRGDGTWPYGLLYDTRGMTGYPSLNDLRQFMKQDAETHPDQRPRGPLAILATDATVYAVACVYAALGGSKRQVEVFRDRADADTWLAAKTIHSLAIS
jgi:hypothetical protein